MNSDFSGPQPLHPKLRAALATLDIQLEAELANYSRLRKGEGRSSIESPRVDDTLPPPLSTSQSPVTAFYNFEADELGPLTPPLGVVDFGHGQAAVPTASLSLNRLDNRPNSNLADLDALPDQLEAELDALSQDKSFEDLTRSLLQPNLSPDDYLESSEALLKNVGAGRGAQKRQSPAGISGWAIAAIAGLGLSLLAAYVILNPGLWHRSRPTPSTSKPTTPSRLAAPAAIAPQGPNLAEKEFIDLNMTSLSQMQPSPSPASGQSSGSRTILPPQRATQTTSSSPRLSQPIRLPPPAAPKTAPRTAAASPSPTAVGVPAGSDSFYYVVMNFTGESTLNQARQVVQGAYIVNFPEGSQIQFGAFNDMASAQTLVQKLKNRGIVATVRQPRSSN